MSMNTFPIDEQDIEFILFEQLDIESMLELDRFDSVSRDEIEMVLNEAYRFARNEVWPTHAIADREGCTFDQGEVKVPDCYHKLYKMYAENGWTALGAPEEMGGTPVPTVIRVATADVLIGANVGFSSYPAVTRLGARLINLYGNDWMRTTFAQRMYSGEWTGTMCLTESQAGTSVGDIRTTATRVEDTYNLTGNKLFISGGEHNLTPNIVHLVLARTPGAPAGVKGLSLFIVPKMWVAEGGQIEGPNGVVCTGIEEKMGLHGKCTCALSFGENTICRALLLGEEGDGMKIMFGLINPARIGTGLQASATAAVAYEHALDYAKERIQGVEIQNTMDPEAPRVPIIKHPDVKRMLLTMKAQVEGMRAMIYKTANYGDLSEYHPDEEVRAKSKKLLDFLTPICKAYCSDTGFDVTVMALQVYGGYGYTQDFPMEQFLRDTKVASIYEGANGIQALDLVARKLRRNSGECYIALVGEITKLVEQGEDHPELGDLVERLKKALGRAGEVTGQFASEGMKGNFLFPVQNATPYLDMLGNLVMGWVLLEQALIAHSRLGETKGAKARYYRNKIRTAAFFIRNLLPQNTGLAESILEGTQDILDVEL